MLAGIPLIEIVMDACKRVYSATHLIGLGNGKQSVTMSRKSALVSTICFDVFIICQDERIVIWMLNNPSNSLKSPSGQLRRLVFYISVSVSRQPLSLSA